MAVATAALHCNWDGSLGGSRSQRKMAFTVRARIQSPRKPTSQEAAASRPSTGPYTWDGQSWARQACDGLEQLIEKHLDPTELPARSDPVVQLAGNFEPVVERPPTQCTGVRGNIPPCLYGGVYVRNGANPLQPPKGGYHYFDGHGMLHAVKLGSSAGENPTYACRYTRTNRYLQEHRAGRPLFPNALGGTSGAAGAARMALLFVRSLLGVVDLGRGDGTANAGLAFHNGRLLAMSENDMPYAVHVARDGDLVTLGRCSFNGGLRGPMTAHPKIDPRTGDMYTYGYNVIRRPYLSYFNVSAAGAMSRHIAVDGITEPVLVHDFAVTQTYAIIPENQMSFSLTNMLKGGSAVVLNHSKVPTFWVLPKHVKDYKDNKSVRSFQVPGFTAFHFVNAWEEGSALVMIGSKQEPLSAVFDSPECLKNMLHEVRIDLSTGEVRQSRVSPAILDVGQLNHRFIGRKSRYAYLSISGPWPRFAGIAKVDLQSTSRRSASCAPTVDEADLDSDPAISAWRKFGNGVYGSEPFFVPGTPSFEPDNEDNGYVLCYTHNETNNVSELLIMDARSPKLETVASIQLPFRVPYGFHGLFITKDQLSRQKQSPCYKKK